MSAGGIECAYGGSEEGDLIGPRFVSLGWMLSYHQKPYQHFELPIFGCVSWLMDLVAQCLSDCGSSDMVHTSSQRGGVSVAPCRFQLRARNAHDERVLIRCRYPREKLGMVHGVTAVVSLLRVAIKHP